MSLRRIFQYRAAAHSNRPCQKISPHTVQLYFCRQGQRSGNVRSIEFSVLRPGSYGSPGDEMRLFLTEDSYQAALLSQQRREIKIKKCAHVIEGHVLYVKKKRRK